jgi:hypothetical protein
MPQESHFRSSPLAFRLPRFVAWCGKKHSPLRIPPEAAINLNSAVARELGE